MTASQLLLAHAVKILILLTLAGILARRRWATCWWFTAYLAVVLVCNSLVSLWPERFYQPWFYIARTGLYDGLKVAIAIDLAYRTFQAFPRAQATARRVFLLLLLASSAVLMAVPWDVTDGAALFEWQPRMLTVTIWMLFALAVVVIWYRVPIQRFHKAILLGLVSYLLVFTVVLRALRHYGWDILPIVHAAEPVAYMLLMGWWAWAAWQPETAPGPASPSFQNRYNGRSFRRSTNVLSLPNARGPVSPVSW